MTRHTLDSDTVTAVGAVIDRWYHLGLIRFGSHDDGGDDLLLRDEIVRALPASPAPLIDRERLADVLHAKVCGPFATIDPQQCIAGRQRDELLADAIVDAYERAKP